MERAGRLIGKLKNSGNCLSPEDLSVAVWVPAVGKRIAVHAKAVALLGSSLVVDVEDAIWQRQLYTLRYQILGKLEKLLGERIVKEIDFRVRIPRPAPQREERGARPSDEADGIQDPVFRLIYKTARKKASA